MTLSRRRFLTISAASVALPTVAQAQTWQGRAFGAEVSITIRGDRSLANQVLLEARQMIEQVEGLFSLYDPGSALSKLNAHGVLAQPDPQFLELMAASDYAHVVTDGLFDPTVQRLWQILSERRKPTEYLNTIGWNRVQFDTQKVALGKDQALTFNGIAQGFATDKVTEIFLSHGLKDVLVNIGEYRGQGGPWRLGVEDPVHGLLGTRTLSVGALATSSPQATPLGSTGHIVHNVVRPQWSTVSVEAPNATLADSLSTAMVLASRDQIEAIKRRTDITRITLIDFDGNLITL